MNFGIFGIQHDIVCFFVIIPGSIERIPTIRRSRQSGIQAIRLVRHTINLDGEHIVGWTIIAKPAMCPTRIIVVCRRKGNAIVATLHGGICPRFKRLRRKVLGFARACARTAQRLAFRRCRKCGSIARTCTHARTRARTVAICATGRNTTCTDAAGASRCFAVRPGTDTSSAGAFSDTNIEDSTSGRNGANIFPGLFRHARLLRSRARSTLRVGIAHHLCEC